MSDSVTLGQPPESHWLGFERRKLQLQPGDEWLAMEYQELRAELLILTEDVPSCVHGSREVVLAHEERLARLRDGIYVLQSARKLARARAELAELVEVERRFHAWRRSL